MDVLIGENGRDHNTYDYELMERSTGANLILRRGSPFHLLLKLNRNYDANNDAVSFIFVVAGYYQLHICYLKYRKSIISILHL